MPSGSRKRKAASAVAAESIEEGGVMDVEPKEEETREASAPEEVPMPPISTKRTRSSLGSVSAPEVPPPSEGTRTYKTRRSSLGARGTSGKGSDGGVITFNSGVTGAGFTIAEDAAPPAPPAPAAARPTQQKPTAVSTRRKSLAAVSALLDCIADENAQENSLPMQPPAKRGVPDLSRALGGHNQAVAAPPVPIRNRVVVRRGVGNGGLKSVSAADADAKDGLSEVEWIDI